MPFLSSTFVLSGRFTDGQKIGQGGCGTVYFAKDSHLGRSVAVKEALPINNSFLATQIRFTRESRIQAALQHTSIIAVYHLEKEPQNGELYLICEYANGGSLEDYLEKHGKLSEEQTIKIALDICAALEVTAREQIVHRDIKPSNILLKVDETGAIVGAKLGDFGIAQDRESLTTIQQGMGQPGTPLYMAPEQASSANVLDVRADIFALGITLWKVLTCEDYKPLLSHTRTPQLSHYNPRTSRSIAAIIQKAVQNDRVQRYGTPQRMADDLRAIGKPVHLFSSFRGSLIITFLLVFVLGLAYLFLLGDKNRVTPIARLTATSMNNTSVTSIATAPIAILQPQPTTMMPTRTVPLPTVTSTPAVMPTAIPATATSMPVITPTPLSPTITSDGPGVQAGTEPEIMFYTGTRNKDTTIKIMKSDGSNIRSISVCSQPAGNAGRSWSRNRDFITFVSTCTDKSNDGYQIYIMNVDGSNIRRLTNGPSSNYDPYLSPDDRFIAFTSSRSGGTDVYLLDIGNGTVTRITNTSTMERVYGWSPDGRYLAFSRDDRIYVLNIETGEERNLINSDEGFCRWSPDGSKILFASVRDGNLELYLMNSDGSNQTNITNNPADDLYADWSPDGNFIVFTSYRSGNGQIYIMNVDGSGVRQLTDESLGAFEPRWK